ncbi:ketosteroid isomerase-like protein [Kitasatospora sp. MAA4]|uniref:nuclear transport factor 2 family protein n=1 Tax=Kitasatospora sp. MAA4 TaxID=3035093 RepID=UPI002476D441|nr:nuclear transport factor 2 family protein [Kitasatospora sp. MAA4]MDH6135011.1 ketosteroid isomerase-like protein [Kitasatospora sp. MAA4]
MSAAATPHEVFERLIDAISSGSWGEIAELYDEDAVVEIPFAPYPPRRIEGRAALRARFEGLGESGVIELRAKNAVVRRTDDPEVIVAEFDYEGRYPATGRTFEVPNILLLRVRGGRIVHSRDFHDHLAFAAAGGALPQLVAAYGSVAD